MGMSASQARLLMITSRQHDIELKAQQLQNAKIQLSTQQDEAYEEYQKALDATVLTINIMENGISSDVAATYNNLFSVNAANLSNGHDYCLIDSRGRVVVSDDLYDAYNDYDGLENPYAFAAWMLYHNGNGTPQNPSLTSLANVMMAIYNQKSSSDSELAHLYSLATTGRGRDNTTPNEFSIGGGDGGSIPFDDTLYGTGTENASGALADSDSDNDNDNNNGNKIDPSPWVTPIPLNIQNVTVNPFNVPNERGNGGKGGDGSKSDSSLTPGSSVYNNTHEEEEQQQQFTVDEDESHDYTAPPSNNMLRILQGTTDFPENCSQFLTYFFNNYGHLVFNHDDIPDEDLDRFNYYARMYSAIQQHGGCISIEEFNGPSGSAATNSEWLTNMIQSGQMSIESFQTDEAGNISTTGAAVSSETSLSYTAMTSLDRAALARAEAEYEHALKVIDCKEQKIDRELNKIETERSALTKQYDSIKKVIDDNIDRTFGIFG